MGATDRIKQFLDYKSITKYKFCNDLGFSNKFLDNSNNMGTDKASKILQFYPEINANWLLTGQGEMIVNPRDVNLSDKVPVNDIPLFNLDAIKKLDEIPDATSLTDVANIKIPNLPKCDAAVSITGNNMHPVLKSGDIVLYKKIDIENIFYGETYLLELQLNEKETYITVNYIQKSEKGADYVKLTSENPKYEPKDILTSKIITLALVKVSIRKNTMI